MRKLLLTCLTAALIFAVNPFQSKANEVDPQSQTVQPSAGHPACAGVTLETPSTPECDAFMASRPAPSFPRVPVDLSSVDNIGLPRFVGENVAIYDAPDGEQIDTVEDGYVYDSASSVQEGWVEIDPGKWVKRENVRFARASSFSGVFIDQGLDMPFAFVLWKHYSLSTPGGQKTTTLYDRYQMVWIFATVSIRNWNYHLVGPGQWILMKNLGIVYPAAPTTFDGNWVSVNVWEQTAVAYSGGAPIMATLISSGVKNGRWDTPIGTFNIYVRSETGTMSGSEGAGDYYSLDFVPFAQYFKGGVSLHGTYWHDSFGYPHSHGCVNMTVSDAKWMYSFVGEGSVVHVYSGAY